MPPSQTDRQSDPNRCFAAWRITYACNFKCPYCTSGRDPSPEAPGGLRNDLYDYLDTVIDNFRAARKNWIVAFTGGEPLVYPNFVKICERFAQYYALYFDTNLSLPIDDLVQAVPAEKVEHVYAALHVAERIGRKKVDVFIHNIDLLRTHGWPLTINYVMYPPLIGQFEQDRAFFESLGFELEPKSFKGSYKGKRYPQSYSQSERELIRKYAPGDSYTKEIPNYKGRRCNAGYRLVRILEDGSMTRCVTDNESLGNVFTGFRLYDEPRRCRVTRCPCYGPTRLFEGIEDEPAAVCRTDGPAEEALAG